MVCFWGVSWWQSCVTPSRFYHQRIVRFAIVFLQIFFLVPFVRFIFEKYPFQFSDFFSILLFIRHFNNRDFPAYRRFRIYKFDLFLFYFKCHWTLFHRLLTFRGTASYCRPMLVFTSSNGNWYLEEPIFPPNCEHLVAYSTPCSIKSFSSLRFTYLSSVIFDRSSKKK